MFILPSKALVGQFSQTYFYLQIVFILLFFTHIIRIYIALNE